MNKKIIVFFHASQLGNNLHPFLVNEIEYLKDNFNEVILICLNASCGFANIEKYENVKVIGIGFWKMYSKLWLFFPELINKYFWKDLRVSISNGIFDFGYIKTTLMHAICGRYYSRIANNLIQRENNTKWYVESYWLSGPAYAAAMVKKRVPNVIAFSRVHSSEADYVRNKYAICQFKSFLDHYLDYIFFVSESAKEQYLTIMKKYYDFNFLDGKYIVNYLGVTKKDKVLNIPSEDGVFRIVSCSRLTPLKRVDVLADTFSSWTGLPVKWTHIGGGEDYKVIENAINSSENCVLLGDMSHDEVMDFYRDNNVDLFINVSKYEGIPVSIMEAMSFGIPIIATDVGGVKEIVNMDNGFLLNRDISIESITTAINDIMNLDKSAYRKKRDYSYWTYCNLLDAKTNFAALLKIIGDC